MVTRRPLHHTERTSVTIRRMHPDDLDAVVQLDASVFGEPRPAYFERRLTSLSEHDPESDTIGLVAESRGAMVGFVMATLTSGEFGFTEITALMDSIAVHPAQQRHGTGKRLIEALVAESTSRGARDMYTLVNWNSWDLLKFFDSLQFGLAPTILLRRRIGETEKEQP